MQQPQKPSLGRVVLFKTSNPERPILVEVVPSEESVKDARGRSWRWPPRV